MHNSKKICTFAAAKVLISTNNLLKRHKIMKKQFITLLFALWASAGMIFADSVISVNDNSVSDWDSLPSQYVFEATCPDSALWTGVSKIRVYADDEYINYAVFYDSTKMSNHTSTDAMHIFINADNSDQTGGYYDFFADAAVDLMLEGNLFNEVGNPIPYSPAVYQWVGPEGGEPSSRTGEWDMVWNLLTYSINGESQIIGNSIIEGRLMKQDIAWRNWSDKFRIGICVMQNWESVGFLPQGNSPDGARIGRTSQLEVAFAPSSTPAPSIYYNITARADSSQNGTVSGSGEYEKNDIAVIVATPRKDCKFEGWNDGNMLNPRSIVVTSDAVYTAIFSRKQPIQPVITADTMYFTAADTTLMAIRVYAANEIEAYDKLIIATVDNKNVMGGQKENYRETVPYVANMNISAVSVMEVVPNEVWYRLRVSDGELAPRCENCTYALNQLYATETGADWYFAQNEKTVIPEAAAYANRQILYNEESKRFSCYRQVSGLDRAQTTVFKLQAPRVIPSLPEEIQEDTTAMMEEEKPMEEIPVEIESKDTAAVISTPYVEFVYSFTLIIWADEARTQVFMMITYDAEGHMISMTKPNALRRYTPQAAQISFEIGDLEPTTSYPYTLIACEDDGSILTSLNSEFSTSGGGTSIHNILDEQGKITKIVINGQLIILRDGKVYNALGTQLQ